LKKHNILLAVFFFSTIFVNASEIAEFENLNRLNSQIHWKIKAQDDINIDSINIFIKVANTSNVELKGATAEVLVYNKNGKEVPFCHKVMTLDIPKTNLQVSSKTINLIMKNLK